MAKTSESSQLKQGDEIRFIHPETGKEIGGAYYIPHPNSSGKSLVNTGSNTGKTVAVPDTDIAPFSSQGFELSPGTKVRSPFFNKDLIFVIQSQEQAGLSPEEYQKVRSGVDHHSRSGYKPGAFPVLDITSGRKMNLDVPAMEYDTGVSFGSPSEDPKNPQEEASQEETPPTVVQDKVAPVLQQKVAPQNKAVPQNKLAPEVKQNALPQNKLAPKNDLSSVNFNDMESMSIKKIDQLIWLLNKRKQNFNGQGTYKLAPVTSKSMVFMAK